jgi:hypothetical protein
MASPHLFTTGPGQATGGRNLSRAMRYGSSGVPSPRIRSQLTLAHDALVRLINALYLIFKFAVVLRQSLDHDVRSIRHVQAKPRAAGGHRHATGLLGQ